MNKILVSTLVLSTTLISSLLFYYFIIYVPSYNKHKEVVRISELEHDKEIHIAELKTQKEQKTKEFQEKLYFEVKAKCIDSIEKQKKELNELEVEGLKHCWATGVCNHSQFLAKLRENNPDYVDWLDPRAEILAINYCIEKYLY